MNKQPSKLNRFAQLTGEVVGTGLAVLVGGSVILGGEIAMMSAKSYCDNMSLCRDGATSEELLTRDLERGLGIYNEKRALLTLVDFTSGLGRSLSYRACKDYHEKGGEE